MDHLCYFSVLRLSSFKSVVAALCSPAGKEPTSWLLFVMFSCNFVTFPCGILGQVWIFAVFLTFINFTRGMKKTRFSTNSKG